MFHTSVCPTTKATSCVMPVPPSMCLRALAVFPGLGLVSASHDMTLRVWDMQVKACGDEICHHHPIASLFTPVLHYVHTAADRETLSRSCWATLPSFIPSPSMRRQTSLLRVRRDVGEGWEAGRAG